LDSFLVRTQDYSRIYLMFSLCLELLMIDFSFLSFSAICCVKPSFPSCLFFLPVVKRSRFNLWDKVPGSDMVLPFLLTVAMFCAAAASLKGVVDEADQAVQVVQVVSDHRMLTCWLLWINSGDQDLWLF